MANLKAESPFGLQPRTTPRVRAEAGHVIVRLELVSLSNSLDEFDIELLLPKGTATALD